MSASPTNATTEQQAGTRHRFVQPFITESTPGRDAFQALLGFSYLQEQIRERRTLEGRGEGASWELQQLMLDEVLHLVAHRALAITGADGIAIALAEGEEIICRASAGTIAPDPGARLDPNSGFSGACFRTRQVIRCEDADSDARVNANAARRLNARSLIAVPLLTENSVVGLLEAFSYDAYAFNDSDVLSLKFLSELILAAMRPEEERRLEEVAERVAERAFAPPKSDCETSSELTAALPSQVEEADIESSWIQSFAKGTNSGETTSPGLRVVFAVVLFATILGTGLWWHMRHKTALANAGMRNVPASSAGQPAAASQDIDELSPSEPVPSGDPVKQKLAVLPQITGVRHWSTPEASTVVIDLQDQVQYEAHRLTSPQRIYFDLHDTALAPGLFGKDIEVGDALLARIRIAQLMPGVTRVVLETKDGSNFSVSLEPDPYRLVVELRAISAPARVRQNIDLFSPAPARPDEQAQFRGATPKFRIVLDAGHGGWDMGTVGRDGLLEKNLVLDVVRRLGSLLQNRSRADVIYTRQDDTYIPLEKRTETANQAQADMFVSIHANYSDDRSARGVETYYANSFSSVNARSREGGASLQGVSFAKLDIRDKVQQSHRFAATLQRALYGGLVASNPGLPNRGVKEAAYVVLTGTAMPAVLAEISFVSSPADEEKLVSATYRQHIAEALYKGIAAYAEKLPSTNVVNTSAKSAGQ